VPLPNVGAGTFSSSAENQELRDDKGAVRLDAGTRAGALSVYYFSDDYRLDNPYPTAQGGANVPGFNAVSLGRAQFANVGLTTTFGPSAINEMRLGYMRASNDVGRPVGGVGPTLASQGFVDAAGKVGIVALSPTIEGAENVSFNDSRSGSTSQASLKANNTYQWSDDFSKILGKHMLKLGAGIHYDQVNINPDAIYNRVFSLPGNGDRLGFRRFSA